MTPDTLTCLGSLALLTGLLLPPEQDPVEPAPQSASLEDLDWITGRWQRGGSAELLEEAWNEPIGNCMTGAFRWLKEGEGWVYEFMLIEQTEKGITFYLRHFGPGAVAWEPVDEPIDFPLKSIGEREVIFEHPERDKMKRLIYRRPDDDTLIVRVEGIGASGEPGADEFRFERVDDSAPRPATR